MIYNYLNFSEDEKLDYLKKLESNTDLLSNDMIWALSKDKDYYIRVRLAQVLVNYHNKLSEQVLTYMLDDKDELVRVNACDSLCWSNLKVILERLIRRVFYD